LRNRVLVRRRGDAVIAHADHSFGRGLTELGKVIGDWVFSGSSLMEPKAAGAAPDAADPDTFREVDLLESAEPSLELDEG
jgi:hypothetical protein